MNELLAGGPYQINKLPALWRTYLSGMYILQNILTHEKSSMYFLMSARYE